LTRDVEGEGSEVKGGAVNGVEFPALKEGSERAGADSGGTVGGAEAGRRRVSVVIGGRGA